MIGRDVQQPKPRHGDGRGHQLGEQVIVEAVAGHPQLSEAGLKFQGTEQGVQGSGGQTEATHRHRVAPILHLAQPGDALVLIYGGKETPCFMRFC